MGKPAEFLHLHDKKITAGFQKIRQLTQTVYMQ